MDPEQTFLRVHARLAGMLSQLLTPRICRSLEYILLAVAVALFGLLVVMHMNFVQQPGCSTELSKIDISAYQLVQIKITRAGLWSEGDSTKDMLDDQNDDISAEKTVTFNGSRRKSIFKSWKSEKEFKDSQVDHAANSHITGTPPEAESSEDEEPSMGSFLLSKRESIKAAVIYVFSNFRMQCCNLGKTLKEFSERARQLWNAVGWHMIRDIPKFFQVLHLQQIQLLLVEWLERGGKTSEPNYLFTLEKGYFLLPEGAKSLHNIRTVNLSISAHHSCFGNRWQRRLINSLVGYDTIMMNSLLSFPGKGYIYSSQTEEFYSLGYGVEQSVGSARFVDYLVTKCSVLIMSLFVFFTTTMSVSFTLRETQSRMLKFTVQLQHHARHNLPTFQLIFVHVIESLVFVPIMIGILFFLFEFYDDQMLAFLVLALVWLCELFTMISVRTPISMQFFPRFFLLYFLVFHIYFFSYSYGFSYLALFTTAAFMQHLILYFWNHYEVPALRRFMRNRSHLQHQGGVQITSSTIVTSTLHIARVNLRNQGVDHNGPQMGLNLLEPNSEELPENPTLDPLPAGNSNSIPSLQFPELNMQQATGASTTGFLNPFGSMLLSLLGGASSEGLISFFSMFRDLRDPHQVYAEEQNHDDAPVM